MGMSIRPSDTIREGDIPDQSFTNILENGDFESWSAGTAVAPDGWAVWHGTVARDSIHKITDYSAKVTATSADGSLYLEVGDYVYYQGKTITFAAWVKSDGVNQARLKVYDGVHVSEISYSPFHTGGNTWELLSVTHTLNAGAAKLEINCVPDASGGNDFAYFDGAIVVEGSVCPAFSPKPLIDDSATVVIDQTTNSLDLTGADEVLLPTETPASAGAAGTAGQIAWDASYIYICVATNTWERAAIGSWV